MIMSRTLGTSLDTGYFCMRWTSATIEREVCSGTTVKVVS